MKQVVSLIIVVAALLFGVSLCVVCTETVGAGYEGFVYDRTAVEAINPSVKTIITSGDGEGYSGLVGVKEVLDSIGD